MFVLKQEMSDLEMISDQKKKISDWNYAFAHDSSLSWTLSYKRLSYQFADF